MSILEEKIRKNSEQYDAHEPAEGHFDRFQARLDSRFHQGERKRNRMQILRYAAGILLIASIATILLIQFTGQDAIMASPVNNELAIVKDHYNKLADQKLNTITTCIESDEEASKVDEMARNQLDKLEQDATKLEKELDKDASNDRVYGALVTNYRTRIKILDNIITRICEL
jgi:hypothetical protein